MNVKRILGVCALLLTFGGCQTDQTELGSAEMDAAPPPGLTLCAEVWVDLARDPEHCGECAHVCAAGESCVTGLCQALSGCNEPCSLAHATSVCSEGTCTIATCDAGFQDCNADPSDGCEVDVLQDTQNCSACGLVCAAGSQCSAGNCSCTANRVVCAGFCRDIASDPNHCGACGVVCSDGGRCIQGVCTPGGCQDTETLCGVRCVNLQSDPENCGACANVCSPSSVCITGLCACPERTTLCAAECVDTVTDPAHCGACGLSCPSGICVAGSCL